MPVCYLGIGSNKGNRYQNIRLALQKLNALQGTKILKVSKIIETKPVGGPKGQPKFLNAALKLQTAYSPRKLLRQLKEIEHALGRTNTLRWGPRTIDLDIIFYGQKIINQRELKVPHPRVFQRPFVFEPLLEVL